MSTNPDLMLVFEEEGDWLNLNVERKKHWSVRHDLVSYWRQLAWIKARNAWGHKPALTRARIHVHYYWQDQRRRDPANWHPTSKAIVDGLVQAGVLPDDDMRHLDGPFEHGHIGPRRQIVVEVFEVS